VINCLETSKTFQEKKTLILQTADILAIWRRYEHRQLHIEE